MSKGYCYICKRPLAGRLYDLMWAARSERMVPVCSENIDCLNSLEQRKRADRASSRSARKQ